MSSVVAAPPLPVVDAAPRAAASADAPVRCVTEALLLRSVAGAKLGRGEKPKALFARVSHFNLQEARLTSAEGIEAA